jgi:hypothetical protein
MTLKLTFRQRLGFAVATIVLATAMPILSLTVVDLGLHARQARWLGYNFRGYRGPVVGRKQPGEYRIVLLGGSVAYGYAVSPTETISVHLEGDLRRRTQSDRFTVINLAYNNEGAHSFVYTLNDYNYLQYDLAILFEGYNDLTDNPPNTSVFRRQSPIFRTTGYLPILPLIFREKAAALLHGGDTSSMYHLYSGDKTVFRPPWTHRTAAAVLTSSVEIGEALARQFSHVSAPTPAADVVANNIGCAHVPYYCQSIAKAVDLLRSNGKQALVATQPYALDPIRARHIQQQDEMAVMLARRYRLDDNVHYVSLGDALDLSDERLSGDRMHPTAEGNARIAAALVEPVIAFAGSAAHQNR